MPMKLYNSIEIQIFDSYFIDFPVYMVDFYKIVSYYLNTICPGRVILDDNILVGQKFPTE